jgi:hypothetical protein
MQPDEFFEEDDLLPDEVLERLAKELPEGCLYCQVRDAETCS